MKSRTSKINNTSTHSHNVYTALIPERKHAQRCRMPVRSATGLVFLDIIWIKLVHIAKDLSSYIFPACLLVVKNAG